MKKTTLISAVAAAVIATTAYGQSSSMTPASSSSGQGADAASFSTLDTNRDGRITQTEAAMHTKLSGAFTTADANSDGALTQTEFSKWANKSTRDTDKSSPSTTSPGPDSRR